MSYIEGVDRNQTQLLPASVEEYVGEEAAVRVIEAFVGGLDVRALGFGRAEPAGTGRPAYAPHDLLKLYLYGYLHRIRSSRRLEAETKRNLEVIWLLRALRPDFKTIADFRRDNRECFKGVFRRFNLLLRKLELFGAELVAIDGAKFKAVNSPRRHYTVKQLTELTAQIDARIEEYLGRLDAEDAVHADLPAALTKEQLQAKLATLTERRSRYQDWQTELAATGQTEISLTDPDSRGQKQVGVGYNVQVAVDAKHDLIAEPAVVQDQNDLAQLHPMATAAQTQLAATTLAVVADAGYHEAGQLEKCEQAGLTTYVPARTGTLGQGPGGQPVYPKTDFTYEAAQDRYRCPAGQTLAWRYATKARGKARDYYYTVAACGACPQRAQCTTAAYRKISRLENEAVVERQAARVTAKPELVAERKTIVEHVFGTLRLWGHDEFLCRGLEMVRAEFSLSALSYNLRRALNLLGVPTLLAAMTARA
ncbi:MAG: IS1182 family transposase [Verrucomicrobia bacterium]|nr:IS1182 family transposase [Verrucomicrobiota bacterium]